LPSSAKRIRIQRILIEDNLYQNGKKRGEFGQGQDGRMREKLTRDGVRETQAKKTRSKHATGKKRKKV